MLTVNGWTPTGKGGGRRVLVLPMGRIDPALLWFVAQGLRRYLPLAQVLLETGEGLEPSFAVDPRRKQARAEMLLDRLIWHKPAESDILGICDVDLYAPGMAFVFGQAAPAEGAAVVSLARLSGSRGAAREDLRRIRALKEAIHEIGHLLGLTHCRNASCIMHFSETIADSDRKGPDFCPRCRKRLPHGT
jgi:archaemetzincin